MPPGTQPPIGVLNQEPSHKGLRVVRLVLILAVIAVIGAVFYAVWAMTQMSGSVYILVRDTGSGERALYTYSLESKKMTKNESADANLIVSPSSKLYEQPDGSVIGLTPAGVVMADTQNRTSVLIASTVAPTLQTPLAVWSDGERIAWLNPADNSIQVFQRSERGAYIPILLNATLVPSSIGFTEDGTVLVATKTIVQKDGKSSTDLFAIKIQPSSSVKLLGSVSGFATIVTP